MGFRSIYKYIRNARYDFPVIEDWISSSSTGELGWASSIANGGANTIAGGVTGHYGILNLSTGTTANATGVASVNLGVVAMVLGGRDLDIIFQNRIPVLSIPALDFYYFVGLGDNSGAGNTNSDGAYFLYDRLTYGDNWQAITADNNTRTIVDTGIPVPVNAWQNMEIRYRQSTNDVQFVIDDVVVATINTNIPTGAGRNFAPIAKIHKVTSSNTARTAQIDWCIIDIKRLEA